MGASRVWSTLLDFRDWPTYVYIALAIFLFGYLPWKAYQFYDQAQVLAEVNEAIAQGDPDLRRVLELVAGDPTQGWRAETIEETPQRTAIDYKGVEMLTHSRIIDLRRWKPQESDASRRGRVYISDRVELKLTKDYAGDHRVTLFIPLRFDDVQFKQPATGPRALIRRVAEPIEDFGLMKTFYELEYDLTAVPIGEPVTLEMEMLVDVPEEKSNASFTMRLDTDLVSMWMLFPEDHPYRTYSLLKYPADRGEPPEILKSRFMIDHPYGNLIGWSVVNPQINNVYECRWEYE